VAESELEYENGPHASPIYQPTVSRNEVRLPVAQFKDYRADLAMYAVTDKHDLTQASVSDLLVLSTSAVECRTPYLLERFIDAAEKLETRAVDCCVNGCLAFTDNRASETACDACGASRYKTGGKPAKKVMYWSLTAWLAHLLSDPIIGKSTEENIEASRKAAEEGADGEHDYFHCANFRFLRDRGLLNGFFVPLNFGTDGFHFWRQNGFEGWPIVVTPLSMSPDQRTHNSHQLLLAVPPGLRQPVDLESFLHPIAEELNRLAKGVPGLIVSNSATPQVLRAGVLNFTTDQPCGDKLMNAKGVNSYVYNRLRIFEGIFDAASSHVYYPPRDPTPGSANKKLFSVHNCTVPRRTAVSIAEDAETVENARAEGRTVAYQTSLEQNTGIKGYSLFFAPRPAMRSAYLYLKDLWDMGPTDAPYDTMHLVLLNVVSHLWKLFSG